MNQDYQRRLELRIDRELKDLPDLAAPPSLLARVMSAVEQTARLPWYRRSWAMWPVALQISSLALLLGLFAALCFVTGKIPQNAEYAAATAKASGWFAFAGMVCNILAVILGALLHAMRQLGTGFLAGCLASLALGYAMCMGLGTLFVRIGLASRSRV
jgi:hypothetical protein